MKKDGLFMVICVLVLFLAPLTRVYIDEPIEVGKENEIFVNINNYDTKTLEDSVVRIFFYDLGEMLTSHTLDIEGKSSAVARIEWTPWKVKPGNYIARVEFSSSKNNVKDWDYVYIPVR